MCAKSVSFLAGVFFFAALIDHSGAIAAIDDKGVFDRLTVLTSYSFFHPGQEPVERFSIMHYSTNAVCCYDYDAGARDFLESDITKLPNTVNYAQHGTGRFDHFLFVPGEQQIYTYGGGANQLDVYKGISAFSEPELLAYAGIGVRKQFERSAQREGWTLEVVQRQNASDAPAPFATEYLLRERSNPSQYKWRAILYSKTGPDGPFCEVDFLETGDKLHTRCLNSEFIDLGGTFFPGKIEVSRDPFPLQVYSVKKVLPNTEVDPAFFQPIKTAPGCVILIHEPGESGGQSINRIDLPQMNDLNASLLKLPDYSPEPAKQPTIIQDPHSRQDHQTAQPQNAPRATDQTQTPSFWKVVLAFAGVLFFGALSLQVAKRRGTQREE